MRNQVEDSLVQLFFTLDKAILEKFALCSKALPVEKKYLGVDDSGAGATLLSRQKNALHLLNNSIFEGPSDLLPGQPWFTNDVVDSIFRCAEQIAKLYSNKLPPEMMISNSYFALGSAL